jgi:hypothetical protein
LKTWNGWGLWAEFVSYGFRLMRAGAFFGVGFLLLASAVSVLAQMELTTEHRITSLETKQDDLARDIAEMKTLNFVGLFGTAGLCGEAGIRLVKKKPGRVEE